ncbi:MAG: NUDIX hydrolase [Solirubrobacteraceae bacterium]|nr:NUDIX hydrolase [Solirubrobacteraceae bacterium]
MKLPAALPTLPAPVLRVAYRYGHHLARGYWYVRRPAVFGVKCLLRDGDGRILLVRHTYGDREAWGLPGGGRHADEPADLTATREVSEEIGGEITTWTPLGDIYSEALHKKDTVTVLLGEWPGGELVLQDSELADAAWFALDELPDRLAFEAEFALERLAAL